MVARPIVAIVRATLLGVLIGLVSAQTVFAQNLLPTPRTWWDLNGNRLADASDSIIGYGSQGPGWTAEKHADVVSVMAAWSTNTDWNPFDASGGGTIRGNIRVDNTVGWCFNNWTTSIVGYTCLHTTPIMEGGVISFLQINDALVGINTQQYFWNFGADDPAFNEYDFRGVLTHEIGHNARLIHPVACANPPLTMCAGGPVGSFTKQLRTLETNDVTEVNKVYP